MLPSWKEAISQLIFDAVRLGENFHKLSDITNFLDIEKVRNSISKPRYIENGHISSNIAFYISKKN